jgi:hypothetical protein
LAKSYLDQTERFTPGQDISVSPAMARSLRAPQWGQNFEPANIIAKQKGQETVASRVPQ